MHLFCKNTTQVCQNMALLKKNEKKEYFCKPKIKQMHSREITATLAQLDEVAKQILITYSQERIFCFYGEMGAGKTTLIKALCKNLGIKNIPSSPTFAIVNEYWTQEREPVYHFDFYRIEKPEEAVAIGIFEYLESGHYCFIEWPENIETIIEEVQTKITIERIDKLTRKISF